ncbi:hypothetical protein QQF64_018668 [Cirrhinus molitorella]|uniref:Uncharacterized protein n=1 Tax=Cirrhinus molitorella TaxID=172907 RepID=A0ABR3LGT9_9TELE
MGPPVPLGSLVPPAPPWSGVDHPQSRDFPPPATPRPSIPPALSGSSFPPAPSRPRAPVPPVPPWLSVSASGSTTTCSAAIGRPPGVGSPSSTMAPPSVGSTVGCHLGWDLGSPWLLLLQLPPVFSLAPPSG